MRGYKRTAALLLLLAVSLVCLTEFAEAAKKRKKSKAKEAKAGSVDPVRCGVCVAAVDEIFKELSTTENSTSTLDLRWGLTAEVKNGRAKRIGKVIKYSRSELRSIEVMEKICSAVKRYERYTAVAGEVQLKTRDQLKELQGQGNLYSDDEQTRDQSKFERFCEELTENSEAAITKAIKDELEYEAFIDAVCYGDTSHPCGGSRSKCQAEEGSDKCTSCLEGFNTTGRGSKSNGDCLKMCEPGHFSGTGLAECSPCGHGAYQPKRGSTKCESCPDGTNTQASASVFATECVSICGDGRRSKEEGCDDGNTYPGDGCDHQCMVEAGGVCSSNPIGSQSSCNKVVCGDGKVQTAADGSEVEGCDDGNTSSDDGCDHRCQDGGRAEACDDGNSVDGDGCSALCQDSKSTCTKPVCGDGYREFVTSIKEECDDANGQNGDGCSSSCTVEEGFECMPLPGAPKRKDATGVGEWTTAGKDNCTAIPGYAEDKTKAKKEGGFFSSMFGGKKKEEV